MLYVLFSAIFRMMDLPHIKCMCKCIIRTLYDVLRIKKKHTNPSHNKCMQICAYAFLVKKGAYKACTVPAKLIHYGRVNKTTCFPYFCQLGMYIYNII